MIVCYVEFLLGVKFVGNRFMFVIKEYKDQCGAQNWPKLEFTFRVRLFCLDKE